MDNNQSRFFYISGAISFSLFFSVAILFAYMIFANNTNKTFGMKKDYISISLSGIPTKKMRVKKRSTPIVKQEVVSKEISKNIDVNDLFSDVWTKKIIHKKTKSKNANRFEESLNKKLRKIQQKKELSIKNEKNTQNNKSDEASQNRSSGSEVNEYLAKIQAIVYQYFSPPQNTQGNSVKCVIELDAFGKMIDFRVLEYSSNNLLNEEVDKVKGRLKGVVFPQNPQHKSSHMVVILISKE